MSEELKDGGGLESARDDDEATRAALDGFGLTESVDAVRAAVASAMDAGVEQRINLYSALEGLSGEIINLLPADPDLPDEPTMMFARRVLEVLVGRFREDAGEIVRYVLTGAPATLVVAFAKAAIEDVRGVSDVPVMTDDIRRDIAGGMAGDEIVRRHTVKGFYDSVIAAAREAASGTEAGDVIEAMFREARDGRG